jgi:hypothetical protein
LVALKTLLMECQALLAKVHTCGKESDPPKAANTTRKTTRQQQHEEPIFKAERKEQRYENKYVG